MSLQFRLKRKLPILSRDKTYWDSFQKKSFRSEKIRDKTFALLVCTYSETIPEDQRHDFFKSIKLSDYAIEKPVSLWSLCVTFDGHMLKLLKRNEVEKFAELFPKYFKLRNSSLDFYSNTDKYVYDELFTRIVPMPLEKLKTIYNLYAPKLEERIIWGRRWSNTQIRLEKYLKKKGVLE